MTPSKPSECAAAISLSEDGADHPFVSIFYTKEDGALYFFALTVHGKTEPNVDGESLLTYNDQGETEPDGIVRIAQGTVYDDGSGAIEDTEFRNEGEGLTFIAALRAVYQMVGEMTT